MPLSAKEIVKYALTPKILHYSTMHSSRPNQGSAGLHSSFFPVLGGGRTFNGGTVVTFKFRFIKNQEPIILSDKNYAENLLEHASSLKAAVEEKQKAADGAQLDFSTFRQGDQKRHLFTCICLWEWRVVLHRHDILLWDWIYRNINHQGTFSLYPPLVVLHHHEKFHIKKTANRDDDANLCLNETEWVMLVFSGEFSRF